MGDGQVDDTEIIQNINPYQVIIRTKQTKHLSLSLLKLSIIGHRNQRMFDHINNSFNVGAGIIDTSCQVKGYNSITYSATFASWMNSGSLRRLVSGGDRKSVV